MDIPLRGLLCSNDDADIYRFFGWRDITAPMDIEAALDRADGEEITLLVNSQGGSMPVGNEIYSMLRRYKGKTQALVQGIAASAATMAMTGCQTISCEPGALLCYHNPMFMTEGDWQVHEKATEELKSAAEAAVNVYMTRTGKSREEVADLLCKDKLISPQEAMEYGLIDEIVNLTGAALEPGPTILVASMSGQMGAFPPVTANMREQYQEHVRGLHTARQEEARRARAKLEALAKY